MRLCLSVLAAIVVASSASADVFEYRSDGSSVVHKAEPLETRPPRSIAPTPRLSPRAGQYIELVARSAAAYQVDAGLILAVIQAESRFLPHVVSPKGAQGLMQLMPETATRFGVSDPFDPAANIDAGTRYLKWLLERYRSNLSHALAAYNAGEEAVDQYGGVPPFPETHDYLERIGELIGRQLKRPPPVVLVAEPASDSEAAVAGEPSAPPSVGLAYDIRQAPAPSAEATDPALSSGLVYDIRQVETPPDTLAAPAADQPQS